MLKSASSSLSPATAARSTRDGNSSGGGSSGGGSGSGSYRQVVDILEQLPNTVSVCFKGVKSYELVHMLSEEVNSSTRIFIPLVTAVACLTYIFCLLSQVACSAGSACHAAPAPSSSGSGTGSTGTAVEQEVKISDVLKAMAIEEEYALGVLRLSFGRHTTEADIDTSAACIVAAVKKLWAAAQT
jgi:hypothetical protein